MSTTTTQKAFRHIGKEYGAPGGGISAFGGAPDKAPTRRPPPSAWGAPAGGPFGQGTIPQPGGPGGLPPVDDPKRYGGGGSGPQGAPTEPFQAKRAYDKLLTLTFITVATGVVGYLA
ncbi:MAG: hypothetical protein M3Y91_19480, partial [Actinomycetota bacterium]|nr:hypothetical protein [Actinomycetota bacterium]